MERQLAVWINQSLVGQVRELNGLWAFRYSQEWLQLPSAYPLCPLLPLQAEEHLDGASLRPVQWYFDNLLPEEGQRRLIAQAVTASVEDAFVLLEHFGAESAGSLTLLPPLQVPQPGQVVPLPEALLSARIKAMPRLALAAQAAKKMSLAGAQHKVAVIYRDGQLFEPIGNEPSTHILKPDHPDDAWAHSVINEWFVMTLAKQVGLPVPKVYRLYVPQPVYLIERFDRVATVQGWSRRHCIDACQLSGLAATFKYSAGSVERVAELAGQCRPAALARLRLFQWLVFNLLVGNEDAHLKNLSFLLSGQDVSLAPFYDLLCTAVYGTRAYDSEHWPQRAALAWPILGVQRLTEISVPLLVQAAEVMGIKPALAKVQIGKLVTQVEGKADRLLAQVLEHNSQLRQSRPELGDTLAGEMRLLRSIQAIVIREMAAQLRASL